MTIHITGDIHGDITRLINFDILPRLKSWDSGIRTTLASVK